MRTVSLFTLVLTLLALVGCARPASPPAPPGAGNAAPTPPPAGNALTPPASPGLGNAAPPPQVGSAPPQDGAPPAVKFQEVAAGLTRPTGLFHAGDGSGRMFALEQVGRIRIIKERQLLPAPFLDLTAKVNSSANERGLLGLAFHPDYRRNGVFFVHYSGARGETVISRFRTSADDPDRGDVASEEVLLTVEQPYANHNGGPILFGRDGYLYIALGDGGSAGDPQNRAQNLETLLGKILRVDVRESGPYKVPADNPFVGKPGRDEIWAYGLRNPWRISFDRATGDLYIADVGQNKLEEINFQPAASKGGENYGWKAFEGTSRYSAVEAKNHVPPVAEYGRDAGCSVTGGHVYRGQAIPALVGRYLYGDYCTGRIWALGRSGDRWVNRELAQTSYRISSFGEDESGELYVVDHGGAVHRIVPR